MIVCVCALISKYDVDDHEKVIGRTRSTMREAKAIGGDRFFQETSSGTWACKTLVRNSMDCADPTTGKDGALVHTSVGRRGRGRML